MKQILYIFIVFAVFNQLKAQDQLGGDLNEGTLRITLNTNTSMEVDRYTNGSWVNQWYGDDDKGFKLYVSSQGSNSDLNFASGYFGSYGQYWPSGGIVLNKIDNYNHITTCTDEDVVEVKQIIKYPANSANILYTYEITNLGTSTMFGLRFFLGGDTYIAGSDRGSGYWDASTNTVGITNIVNDAEVNIFLTTEDNPYSYYADYAFDGSFVLKDIISDQSDPKLGGQVTSSVIDIGIALEWRKSSLSPGETWTISAQDYFNNKFVSDVTLTAPSDVEISPCETKDIIFDIENTTGSAINSVSLSESIDLSADGWSATITDPIGSFSLAAFETTQITVSVTAPCDATPGQIAQNRIEATTDNGLADDVAYITVTAPSCASSLTSAVGSDNQTICQHTAIENITYSTLSATGIGEDDVSGGNSLPDGISATWAGDVVTISGTATETGVFNYSIPLVGGDCSGVAITGTITISDDAPQADAGSGATICAVDSFSALGNATNGSVEWLTSGDGSFNDETITSPIYSLGSDDVSVGSVNLTMVVTGTGICASVTDSSNITVLVNSQDAPLAEAGPGLTLCAVDTFTANATSSNGTILWTTSGSGEFIQDDIEDVEYIPSSDDILAGAVALTLTTTGIDNECNTAIISDALTLNFNNADAPIATVGNDTTICHEDTLNINASTSNGTIQWYTSGNGSFSNSTIENPSYIPSQEDVLAGAISLTLEVSGQNNECSGSVASQSFNLIINNTSEVNLSHNYAQSICEGEELEFSVVSNQNTYQYFINDSLIPGSHTNNFSFNNFNHQDTFYARVLFSNGCWTRSDSLVINVNDTLDISLSSDLGDTICASDLPTFTATPSGANLYDFSVNGVLQQSSSSNSFSPNLNTNASISVLVQDANTCQSGARIDIGVNPNPTLNLTGTTLVCVGSDASFEVSNSNGDNQTIYHFIKSLGGNIDTVQSGNILTYTDNNVEENATFWVTAEQNGCIDSSQKLTVAYITEIEASMSVDAPTCQGAQATVSIVGDGGDLVGGNYTFFVNGIEVQSASSDFTYNYLPNQNGTDEVYAFIESGGCQATLDPITIAITDTPIASLSNSSIADALCQGDCVSFSVTSNQVNDTYNFLRNGISSIPHNNGSVEICDLEINNSEFIEVEVENTQGCSITLRSKILRVDPNPSIDLVQDPIDLSICSYETFTIQDNGNGNSVVFDYVSNSINGTSGASYTINDLNIGNNNFTVTSTLGNCSTQESFVVAVIEEPFAVLTLNDDIYCSGEEVIVTEGVNQNPPNGLSFTFTINGNTASSIDPNITINNNQLAYTNAQNNDIITVVVDYNGCQSTDNITVSMESVDALLTPEDDDYLICEGQEIAFTASGGNTYSYFINGIPTSDFPQGNSFATSDLEHGDIVSVTAYSTNNCQDEFYLPPIIVEVYDNADFILENDTVCAVGNTIPSLVVDGNLNGYWSISPDLDASIFDNSTGEIDLNEITTGEYEITFTSVSNCPSQNTELLVVLDALTVPDLGSDQLICNRTETTIDMPNISSGIASWTTDNESVVIDSAGRIIVRNLQIGLNNVFLEISNDICEPTRDTLSINVRGVTLDPNAGNDIFCYSDTIKLNAVDHVIANSGQWRSLSGNVIINNPKSAGSYVTGLTPNVPEVMIWEIEDTFCYLSGSDTMILLNSRENIAINTQEDSTKIIVPVLFSADPSLMSVWTWSIVDENIELQDEPLFNHIFYEPGIYTIRLDGFDKNGCVFSQDFIYSIYDVGLIYVPNMFSPNGDGDNDDIGPFGYLEQFSDYSFSVFNRWGHLVFESKDPHDNWNGRKYNDLNSPVLPNDGYSYVMSYIDENGNSQINRGYFILIR